MDFEHECVKIVIKKITGCKTQTLCQSVLDGLLTAPLDDSELLDVLSDQLYLLYDVDAPLCLNLESSSHLILLQSIELDVLKDRQLVTEFWTYFRVHLGLQPLGCGLGVTKFCEFLYLSLSHLDLFCEQVERVAGVDRHFCLASVAKACSKESFLFLLRRCSFRGSNTCLTWGILSVQTPCLAIFQEVASDFIWLCFMLFVWTFSFEILFYNTSCDRLLRAGQAVFKDYWPFVSTPIIDEVDTSVSCSLSHEGLSHLRSLQGFGLQSFGLGFAKVATIRGVNV